MDDIGNLVYILVFVIWFLYKTFVKGQKKKNKPQTPFEPHDSEAESPGTYNAPSPPKETYNAPSPPPVTFEDVLRELTGAPPAPIEKPITEEPGHFLDEEPDPYLVPDLPTTVEETSFEVYESPKDIKPVSDPMIWERHAHFKIKKERASKATRGAIRMLKTKQGAKQAFIVKEIFDRKY